VPGTLTDSLPGEKLVHLAENALRVGTRAGNVIK
jgi:hypothetical protein